MKTKLWAGDTEDNSKGLVYLINFYDGKKHYTFKRGKREEKRAIEFLLSLKGSHHFWFTNLQYDLNNIFKNHLEYLECVYVGSRIIEAKITNTDIRFRDTLNHWKISVEEMGKRINLHKFKTKNQNFNDLKYCRRDTKIVYNFVHTMKSHYESIGAKLKATIGSTSLKYFEENFYKKLNFSFLNKKDYEFMLQGYYGGRTEIFFNKPIEGNIQYYDINSLYPYCCTKILPRVTRKYIYTQNPDFTKFGIVKAKVKAPKNLEIPYLPYKNRDGKLLFPLGTFTGHWTYFEINEAKRLGYEIIRIYKAIEFQGGYSQNIKPFIETLYQERLIAKKKNDELLSDAYKLLMNNLYGKFGQKNEKTSLIPYTNKKQIRRGDTLFNKVILRKEIGDYPKHSNVIWSAYITAYGRHELYLKMQEVIKKNGLLIYCDTDSVIFEHKDRIFNDETELGKFKLEGLFKYAYFRLPKEYKLVSQDDTLKYKTKGVPKKNQAEFFEKRKVKFKRPLKLREVLRRNLSPKRKIKLKPNFWTVNTKESSKLYDKRIVLNTGHTRPFIIGG